MQANCCLALRCERRACKNVRLKGFPVFGESDENLRHRTEDQFSHSLNQVSEHQCVIVDSMCSDFNTNLRNEKQQIEVGFSFFKERENSEEE